MAKKKPEIAAKKPPVKLSPLADGSVLIVGPVNHAAATNRAASAEATPDQVSR